jgi:hypothetical protein
MSLSLYLRRLRHDRLSILYTIKTPVPIKIGPKSPLKKGPPQSREIKVPKYQ